LAAATAVASITIALAGCGGGHANRSASATSGAHASATAHASVHRTVRTVKAKVVTPATVVVRSRDRAHRTVVVKAHGKDNEAGASGGSLTINPCTLVSISQVQALTRRPVAKSVEAPQGPTCVYEARGRGHEVTLEITALSFRAASKRLSSVIGLTIAGHQAYCGVFGTPIAYVSLTQGRVMTIGAPCPVAAAMAKAALARLPRA
jgi:hypothetical protein